MDIAQSDCETQEGSTTDMSFLHFYSWIRCPRVSQVLCWFLVPCVYTFFALASCLNRALLMHLAHRFLTHPLRKYRG